jgi:hypothetical protein
MAHSSSETRTPHVSEVACVFVIIAVVAFAAALVSVGAYLEMTRVWSWVLQQPKFNVIATSHSSGPAEDFSRSVQPTVEANMIVALEYRVMLQAHANYSESDIYLLLDGLYNSSYVAATDEPLAYSICVVRH